MRATLLGVCMIVAACAADATNPAPDDTLREPLPALPDEASVTARASYKAVQAFRKRPLPRLAAPAADPAAHQAWVDAELDPWREHARMIGTVIYTWRPRIREVGDSDAAQRQYDLDEVIYLAVSAALSADEAITFTRIQLPPPFAGDAEVEEGLADVVGFEVREALNWATDCAEYEPLRPPLGPATERWTAFCRNLAETLRDR